MLARATACHAGELVTAKAHVLARTAQGPSVVAVLPHEVQLHDAKQEQQEQFGSRRHMKGRRRQDGAQQTHTLTRASEMGRAQQHGQQRVSRGSQRREPGQGAQRPATPARHSVEQNRTEAWRSAAEIEPSVPAADVSVSQGTHLGAAAAELVEVHAGDAPTRAYQTAVAPALCAAPTAAHSAAVAAMATRNSSRSEYWQQWLD